MKDLNFNSDMIRLFNAVDGKSHSKKLYHYTSSDAFISIIKNGTLRFTDIKYMNDKSECIFFIKVLLDFLFNNNYKHPLIEEAINNLIKEDSYDQIRKLELLRIHFESINTISKYVEPHIYAMCFTTDNDSLAMWNYYVHNQNYEGYSLEISLLKFLQAFDIASDNEISPFYVYHGKVLYSEKDQYNEIQRIISIIEKEAQDDIDKAMLFLRQAILSNGIFFKSPKFSHEKEYRIAICFDDEDKLKLIKDWNNNHKDNSLSECFYTKRGIVTPCLELEFNKKALNSVTIPPIMEKEIAKTSIQRLLETYNYSDVSVENSKIPIRF